jgi:hypothetical protein
LTGLKEKNVEELLARLKPGTSGFQAMELEEKND